MGETQMITRGQLYKVLWVEKEADAKILRQGITWLVVETAGHCSWDPVSKRQLAGSVQRTGMCGLLSYARKLRV